MTSAQTAVITGSASGIGAATAERLRAAGWRVIGIDLRGADVAADLGTETGRRDALSGVRDLAGEAVDAVVASAGVNRPMEDPRIVAINYFGAVRLLEGLRPLLAKSSAPRAVAVSSLACTMEADPDVVAACLDDDEPRALAAAGARPAAFAKQPIIYCSSKTALSLWARRAATSAAWGGAGILLNVVAPGVVRTALTAPDLADPERARVLLGRAGRALPDLGRPQAIAHLIEALISPDNDYMLGQVLFADGGADALRRPEHI
jgi:NAD(P)-dependent dehydrogenase (short-subunit alcohol dehydrogenase family)